MKNPRETHTVLMAKIKKSMKKEIDFKIGDIKIGDTSFYNKLTVYFQEEKFEIEFVVSHKKIFLINSENLKTIFYNIFPKQTDIKELYNIYRYNVDWYVFLSIMTEISGEISIPNFKQKKEYKLRSLYDKKFEQFFDNLSCNYVSKINRDSLKTTYNKNVNR